MDFPGKLRARLIALSILAVVACPAVADDDDDAKRCLTECVQRIGVVSAFGAEADILLAETSGKRSYRINGNVFTTGRLRGNRVVIVLTGVSIENATMITQLMIDHFNIERLVLSGIAGGINPGNHVGDVVIAERWALPFEVYWNGDSQVPAPCGASGDLSCLGLKLSTFTAAPNSDFQIPRPSGPVGTGIFMRENFVLNEMNAPNGEFRFDYEADPEMLAVARSINPQLDRCGPANPSLCVSVQPQVRFGGRGMSGPVFLANPDYRDYIFRTIQAEAVDMETGAFGHVAYANQIPFIAFRSLSDLAGGGDFNDVGAFFGSGLAESNASKVTLGFLEAWARSSRR